MEKAAYKSNLTDDEKVLMAIVRAAETFKRVHSGIFRRYGLSFPQYNVLRVLDASGKGRNRMTDVSRIMLVPGANITGIAKRLEKGGFILRKSDPKDERVTILQITPKGKEALKCIEDEKNQWVESMLSSLSAGERLDLLEKLRRLVKNDRLVKG